MDRIQKQLPEKYKEWRETDRRQQRVRSLKTEVAVLNKIRHCGIQPMHSVWYTEYSRGISGKNNFLAQKTKAWKIMTTENDGEIL